MRTAFCWALVWGTFAAHAAGADSLEKRTRDAEISKLRGRVTLIVKRLPASYAYAAPDAEDAAPEPVQELRGLSDPLMFEALSAMIGSEKKPAVRALYLELLAGFKNKAAHALVVAAVTDKDAQVRQVAVKGWERIDVEKLYGQLGSFLRPEPHHQEIKYRVLDLLNNSGLLDRVPEEGTTNGELVRSLIACLHRPEFTPVPVDRVAGGQVEGGFKQVQRRDVAIRTQMVPDPVVHSVLTRVTKQDFGFDLAKWNRFYDVRFR